MFIKKQSTYVTYPLVTRFQTINWKAFIATALLCLIYGIVMGQSGEMQEAMEDVVTEVNSVREPVRNLLYAVAAILMLVGGFRIYGKMSQGKPVTEDLTIYLGGAVFVVMIALLVDTIFPQ